MEKSLPIHQKNLQILATEIYRTKNGVIPEIMNEIFNLRRSSYYFRNNNIFIRINVRTVRYGTKTISFLGSKIWNLLPIEFKETGSLHKFKTKIPDWEKKGPCHLCKIYLPNMLLNAFLSQSA